MSDNNLKLIEDRIKSVLKDEDRIINYSAGSYYKFPYPVAIDLLVFFLLIIFHLFGIIMTLFGLFVFVKTIASSRKCIMALLDKDVVLINVEGRDFKINDTHFYKYMDIKDVKITGNNARIIFNNLNILIKPHSDNSSFNLRDFDIKKFIYGKKHVTEGLSNNLTSIITDEKAATIKLYPINAIIIATFFGGPLAAGILARQNFINLGKKSYGKNSIITGIISTLLIFAGIFSIPQDILYKIPNILIPAVYTIAIYFIIEKYQGEALRLHKEKDGEFFSGWKATGAGIICTVILLGGVLGFSYLAPGGLNQKKYGRTADIQEQVDTVFARIKADNANKIKDIDGNIYSTVRMGNKIWMAENIRTTKYNDGTAISELRDSAEWVKLKKPGYSWYDNDSSAYKNLYGALYNGYIINKDKLCPEGWHVPSESDWQTLTYYLGNKEVAAVKLREIGNKHWSFQSSSWATNESGFTALPGGFRDDEGKFKGVGVTGDWWSSTKADNGSRVDYIEVTFDNYCVVDESKMNHGKSIRCLMNDTLENFDGLAKNCSGTITDIAGNNYKIITIGNQIWMAENLKTNKYNDGNIIPNKADTTYWGHPACIFDKDTLWIDDKSSSTGSSGQLSWMIYGAVYNWFAVNTGKLCPAGWHVPTDAEWTVLTDYLGGEKIAGGKLKETGARHWLEPNSYYATNESGFTALGIGFRECTWWSTTEFQTGDAWCRKLEYNNKVVARGDNRKEDLYPVRCLKNK